MATLPGDGFTSPFGNGAGATQEAPSPTKGTDFTLAPTGQGRKTPVDNEKIAPNRAQRAGKTDFNADTVPAGGRTPFADPGALTPNVTKASGNRKPFKLKGAAASMDGEPSGEGGVGGLPA